MTQEGFISRASVNYNNGKRVTNRGFDSAFDALDGTYHDYMLNIRQSNVEEIVHAIGTHLITRRKKVFFGWALVDFQKARTRRLGTATM